MPDQVDQEYEGRQAEKGANKAVRNERHCNEELSILELVLCRSEVLPSVKRSLPTQGDRDSTSMLGSLLALKSDSALSGGSCE